MRNEHGIRRLAVVNISITLVVERVGRLGSSGSLGGCEARTLQR